MVRKWVFPIIRIVVFAAIAAALVKIAFFAEPGDPDTPDFPSATIVEPQVPVSMGTIENTVVLTGTVAADDAVPVKSTAPGIVRTVQVAPGAWADAGAQLFVIREEVIRDDGTSWLRDIKITATAPGTVSAVSVIAGQAVAVGEVIAKIAPTSFHVAATLEPEQQYRLLNRPTEAQVSVSGGPAAFTCTGLAITTLLAGAAEESTGGTTVTCTVPGDVTVFAGLAATVSISGGTAENVLTVPITAVEGTSDTGNVHIVLADGTTEVRPVTLGLNDGANVEVRDGLAEGDTILQFVPGAQEAPDGAGGENCYAIAGGVACESMGG